MKKILFLLTIVLLLVTIGCVSESEGHSDMNSHDDLHDHSVEVEGKDMKALSVGEVAYLWDIDSQVLLDEIILEFDLKENYTSDSILEDIREEYAFSPAIIKDIAEDIKQRGIINE